MRNQRSVLAGLVTLGVLLVACADDASDQSPDAGSPTSSPPSGSPTTEGSDNLDYAGTWELRSGFGPQGDIELIERYPVTMRITRKGLYGRAACNNYGMRLRILGASFETSHGSGEQMGCSEEVNRAEERFVAALIDADTVERKGTSLTLTGPDADLRFEMIPAPPVKEMIGPKWRFEKVVVGDGDRSIAALSGDPAILRFRPDRSFDVWTGCAPVEGNWRVGAGEIAITQMRNGQRKCSPQLERQHDLISGGLGDAFRAEVEGDTLTITGRFANDGVVFRRS